ncbi:MAG: hypothetical protein AB2L11_04145 [Syntrophobacteraceae bacterium]
MPRPPVVERPFAPSREELILKLHNRIQYWQYYRSKLHIGAESPKGKLRRMQTVVLAIPPNLFRLEAFSMWGQTVGALVSDETGSSLLIPSEKVIFSAARPETLIEHFIGVPVSIETLLYALTASIPPDRLDKIEIRERDTLVLAHSDDPQKNRNSTWEFIRQPLALKAVEVQDGPRSYKISYDPPVSLDPQQTPSKISFVSSQWRMEVTVDQLEASPDLPASSFRMSFPVGMRSVDLDKVKWNEKNL